MHAAILTVTSPPPLPGHTPRNLQYFSFLEVVFPTPGQAERDNSPPPLASDRPHIRFLPHLLIRIKGNQHIFTTFMNVFLSLLREG